MKNPMCYVIALLMAVALYGAPVLAQAPQADSSVATHEPSTKDTAKMEKMAEKMDSKLGLSKEQRAKMKELRQAFAGQGKTTRSQLKAKQEELRKELDSNAPSQLRAENLAKEIIALKTRQMQDQIEHTFKLREILTLEQFMKFQELKKDRRGKKHQMPEGCHCPGQ